VTQLDKDKQILSIPRYIIAHVFRIF